MLVEVANDAGPPANQARENVVAGQTLEVCGCNRRSSMEQRRVDDACRMVRHRGMLRLGLTMIVAIGC